LYFYYLPLLCSVNKRIIITKIIMAHIKYKSFLSNFICKSCDHLYSRSFLTLAGSKPKMEIYLPTHIEKPRLFYPEQINHSSNYYYYNNHTNESKTFSLPILTSENYNIYINKSWDFFSRWRKFFVRLSAMFSFSK